MPPSRERVALFTLLSLFGIWFAVHALRRSASSAAETDSGHGRPSFRQRLVAVGDLHGDLRNTLTVLRMAGVVGANAKWTAGTDILVQTGDIVDRGTYASDIYRLMQSLRSQAAGAGGSVISILGNHEIMNAIGDWRYVTQEDIKHFGSVKARQEALSVNGWLGQEWLANYSTTALVALAPYPWAPKLSFTHGSLRPSFANLLPYPDAINRLGHSLLTKALTPPLAPPHPPYPYQGLPRGSTDSEMDLYAAGGPYWWRGLAEVTDEATVCGWAEELKTKLGVRRVIGGHTPDFEKIVHRCSASVIIIDTGISSAYGGVLSALEIVYTLTPAIDTNPHQEPFMPHILDVEATSAVVKGLTYIEREEVYAIYPKRKKLIAVEERTVTA